MSVVKRKRKESPFEVFHHLTKMRKDITDLLLRDFGYSNEKFQKKMEKWYGILPESEFDNWIKSWMCGYAKYMSKDQRKNIYKFSEELKSKNK